MITLRDYQEAAVNSVLSKWNEADRLLGVAPTGSGKTIIFSAIAERRIGAGPILILAHRDELLEQARDKIASFIDELSVDKEQGENWADLRTDIVVASVQSLSRTSRLERFLRNHFGTVIVDECFPAGTLIDGRRIETLRPGDYVRSFNHQRGAIELRPITRLFKRQATAFVRLSFSDGRQLVCTPNHPFWNGISYIRAAQLVVGQILYAIHEHRRRNEASSQALQLETLSQQSRRQGIPLIETGVWFASNGEGARINGRDEPTICGHPNNEVQSDGEPRCARADESHASDHPSSAQGTRRQWQALTAPAAAFGSKISVANRMGCADANPEMDWIPTLLQNRYCESGTESRNRNRRALPLRVKPARDGRQKIGSLIELRLDRVEVLEPGSDGRFGGLCTEGAVYNFEVAHHNNYFANGVLVHNCHHTISDSYLKILQHFAGAKVLGVSATPDRGDRRSLSRYYEAIAFELSLTRLIKDKWLCPIKVRTVPLEIDISRVSLRAGDYSDEELAQALEPVLRELAHAVKEHAAERKSLVFLPLVRTAYQFAEILRELGLAAEAIDGQSPDRKEILARFKSGQTRILCNAMLLTEGYDEPSINCVIPLRPTTIRSLYSQQVGRGTRIHPGKNDLLLLDFLWLSREHNLVMCLLNNSDTQTQPVSQGIDGWECHYYLRDTRLVKAPSLIAKDEQEQAQIQAQLAAADGDLLVAESLAQDEREAALKLRLDERRHEQGAEVDLLELAARWHAPDIIGYRPTFNWERKPVSDKQVAILERNGINPGLVQDRGHAAVLLDSLFAYLEHEPASVKQKRYCRFLGHPNPGELTKREAGRWIAQHKEQLTRSY